MAGKPNAFSVYSSQRRQNITPLDITPHSYLASNGLFFVHGPYYVEIISAENSPGMQAAMGTLAQAFIQSRPGQWPPLVELDLLPTLNRKEHSTELIAHSAFGIESLDWVYTATHAIGDRLATSFIMPCASPQQAADRADVFVQYWIEYGGETVNLPAELDATALISILETYEIAMVQGRYFFGVHDASHLDFGVALIEALQQTIGATGS
jgi:hypothetical protein